MRVARFSMLVAVTVIVAACSGTGDSDTTTTGAPAEPTTQPVNTTEGGGSAAPASITIANFDFSGAESVPVGTTVVVTNEDDVSHTWTSEDDVFDSGSLSQGESFSFTFEDAGEYAFVCNIHPGMTGSITVEG